MSTTFNREELSFIQRTDWFEQKNAASGKTTELLHRAAQHLKSHIHPPLKATSFKVSKGENYKGFPYFVLDIPKIASKENMATFRTIIWWGHDITFHIILGESALSALKDTISSNLTRIQREEDIYYNATDDIWNHDMDDRIAYKPVKELTEQELQTMKELKFSKRFPLEAINALDYHAAHSATLFQKILTDQAPIFSFN